MCVNVNVSVCVVCGRVAVLGHTRFGTPLPSGRTQQERWRQRAGAWGGEEGAMVRASGTTRQAWEANV